MIRHSGFKFVHLFRKFLAVLVSDPYPAVVADHQPAQASNFGLKAVKAAADGKD